VPHLPKGAHICHRLHYVHRLNDIYPKGGFNIIFDMCPIYLLQDFSIAHIRHIHFFDAPISKYIIGWFRSTVLQVMSLTRFLCATMILYAPPSAYRQVAISHFFTIFNEKLLRPGGNGSKLRPIVSINNTFIVDPSHTY
jgi:hypothetical protein